MVPRLCNCLADANGARSLMWFFRMGKDEDVLETDYMETEDLHPESTDSAELKKCLHAGVIPEAYQFKYNRNEV